VKGFSKLPTKSVTLTRGDESVILEMTALPPGWGAMVRSAMKPPQEFVSGKPVRQYGDPEYNDLFGMLVIGKTLQPSGILSTKIGAPWRQCAEKLRDEFIEAGLTSGDLERLAHELKGLDSMSQVEEIRGN